MNHQKFASIIFAFFLMIGLSCGMFGGDDDSALSSAGTLPAQPSPDLEKIDEQTVTKMHEDASAGDIQDLVSDTVSGALEAHENSTDAPLFSSADDEDDILHPTYTPTELDAIWEAWEHLNRDFVEQEKLGPELATEFEGDFQGIGAYVEMNARGHLVISSPIEGGPADLAGIKPGDIILKVDGESLEGLTTLEAVSKIRGPKDSITRLLVKKPGQIDPVLVEITRAVIPLTSVRL